MLDPWQQLVVRAILAEQADGRYAASEAGFLVARQNGKGGILEAVVLHGLFLVEDPLTLWTAHQTKTSFEAFQRVKAWVDGSADLTRKVKGINSAHGEEGITLHSGVRLRFVARSKSSGRGFSPQRVIFDEAQELSKLAIEALLPAMGAQPNRQAVYCGTVPGPEVNHPEHWTRLRDRGRSDVARRLAWVEWSPEGSDNPMTALTIDLGSPKVWRQSNPALWSPRPNRKSVETISDYHEALEPDSFAREECSIWPSTSRGEGIYGNTAWDLCAIPEQEPTGELVLGLAVSHDRAWSSLGAASMLDDDRVLLAAVDRRRGTSWVVDEVARIHTERGCQVVIDGLGPASSLVDALNDAGVPVVELGTGDVCDASADLYDKVQAKAAAHMKHEDLDDAVACATKRNVGKRWALGRKDPSDDISMLEAVNLAAWLADSTYDPLDSIG